MCCEIGSHFEYDYKINSKYNKQTWLPNIYDANFTFSGKSAIELVIKDIKLTYKINNVYMPSYCCNSMVDPFINNGINVMYYEVFFDVDKGIQYNIDLKKDYDIFFAMSYFGIEKFKHENILKIFKEKGTIIIEDVTHRLLNEDNYSKYSDYIIASLRKWLPIATGGYVSKKNAKIKHLPVKETNSLAELKLNAMKQKAKYLKGENISKNKFLKQINDFEKKFENNNSNYKIDDTSLSIINNIEIIQIKKIRRKNAKILYDGIKKLKHIKMLVPNPVFDDYTPLFLPIMIKEQSKRDSLRLYLIERNVYCPVHWPKTNDNVSNINQHELSLICDQRYTEKDMDYIVQLIKKWYENHYNK